VTATVKVSTADLLREAAGAIATYGWIQGSAGYEEVGFCAVGALSYAIDETGGTDSSYAAAYSALLDEVGGRGGSVVMWNDAPDRTKEQVIDTLCLVADRLEVNS